jgi:hypothetical protein
LVYWADAPAAVAACAFRREGGVWRPAVLVWRNAPAAGVTRAPRLTGGWPMPTERLVAVWRLMPSLLGEGGRLPRRADAPNATRHIAGVWVTRIWNLAVRLRFDAWILELHPLRGEIRRKDEGGRMTQLTGSARRPAYPLGHWRFGFVAGLRIDAWTLGLCRGRAHLACPRPRQRTGASRGASCAGVSMAPGDLRGRHWS